MEVQKHLFETVKKKIAKHESLSYVIEELLGLSTDSAYRRISGKTELTISELQKICEKFNISMDEIFNYKSVEGALFHYGPLVLSYPESSTIQIEGILKTINGLKSSFEKEIFFSALDVPFYHYAKFPELTFFRQYAWNEAMNPEASISYNEFCSRLDTKKIVSLSEQYHKTMMLIPTKEIWTYQTIDPVLRLMEHYYDIGAFDGKNTALFLLDRLDDVFDMLRHCADEGFKDAERKTSFYQYLSHVDLESTFMLLRKDDQLLCVIRLNTLNSISTDNEAICMRIQKWMDDAISKSVQISSISVRERIRFYKSAKNKIDSLREKIKSD